MADAEPTTGRRSALACPLAVLAASCSALPLELNLSPIYRHRLDEDRTLLELDVAWPIVHYERTASGGDDFRVRPLWRRVHEGAQVEHQFLWPFGRVVADEEEVDARLFPLWTYRWRINAFGQRELEWEAPYPVPFLPFFAGGVEAYEDGSTASYFGFNPIYADLRGYLTYDRYRAILFPLYVGTRKGDRYGHTSLFWLLGYGGRAAAPFERWHRALPLYAFSEHPGVRVAYAFLWPLFTWGREKLDSADPVRRFLFWPLFGWQRSTSGQVRGWSVLWPLFQSLTAGERYYRLDFLWPLIRYLRDDDEERPLRQWWFWPFVSRTDGRYQQAWSILWPLIWWRWFQDPVGTMHQRWVLPFYWHVAQSLKDGRTARFTKLWPLWHHDARADGTSDWSIPSPWFWRAGNAYGMEEAYGFAWTLVAGRRHAATDHSLSTFANLYTRRQRGSRRWASVPLLFSYEDDGEGGTLRLLQCIPIRLGGGR